MKWIRSRKSEGHPELTPQEARQVRWGRPVLNVLIAGIAGLVVAYLVAGEVMLY